MAASPAGRSSLNVTEIVSELPLTGRVALVTGASSPLGRACALALARAGCSLALQCGAGDEAEAKAVDDLADACERESPGKAIALAAAIGVPEEVERLWVEVTAVLGAPTVFVHAAGDTIDGTRALGDTTPADWRALLRTNLDAAFFCARALLPAMRAQGFGRIVLLTGAQAEPTAPAPGEGPLAAARAALVSLTRTLAAEESGRGVSVNAVGPGSVPPENVARVVAFLASPASEHISGAHIAVGRGGIA